MSTSQESKYIFPQFEEIQAYKQEKRACELFKEYFENDFTFRSIIVANFMPDLKFFLPEGAPPYESPKEDAEATSIRRIFDKKIIAKYVDTGTPVNAIRAAKLENSFVLVLEGLTKKDAEIIIAMKDKKLTTLYPMITHTFATKAVGDKLSDI
jgi:hypothetical protein|tara:strand:- start:3740 stop:4198 length:459 start_codon:yes stop_codon:yes gene_type:complete